MTIRELYRRNRRNWFGRNTQKVSGDRKKYGLEMVVFQTIQQWMIECRGLHPDDEPGWRANSILAGHHLGPHLKPLMALLRFYDRINGHQGRTTTTIRGLSGGHQE